MAPSTAIFISLPSPFLKVINCNHLHLCYGVLVVGSMLRCACCPEMDYSPAAHLVKEESSLPKHYQLQPFGSVLRCTCGWIFVTVYLLEMYYVKPYHLPIIYYLVYGVMGNIRIEKLKVMMSWSKYKS